MTDVGDNPDYGEVRARLEAALAAACYGRDIEDGWVRDGRLEGYDPGPCAARPDRSFSAQRGLQYPQPPARSVPDNIGFPE